MQGGSHRSTSSLFLILKTSARSDYTQAGASPTKDPATPETNVLGEAWKNWTIVHISPSLPVEYVLGNAFILNISLTLELELTHSTYGSSHRVSQLLLRPVFTATKVDSFSDGESLASFLY